MLMAENKYVRLCRSIHDKGILVKPDQILDKVTSEEEWYTSVFFYNQSQYNQFKQTGTVSGIKDVITNKIWFDLDSSTNPESARKDSVEIINRLKNYKIKEKNIELYFSGNKGIHIIVNLSRELTPKKVGDICKFIGKGIATLDLSVYNASRILRVPGTKHAKSGLYKFPLTVKQIQTMDINQIKTMAASNDNVTEQFNWENEELPEEVLKVSVVEEKKEVYRAPVEYNKSERPKHWNEYKWALLNAIGLKPDERHQALMVLAATCKGIGYPVEITRAMLSTFDEKFQVNTGKGPVEDLDSNVLPSVYSDSWSGGLYSYKNNVWLQQYCERIGVKPDLIKDEDTISIDQAYSLFKDYADNIDSMTIKTGIKSLDENLRITIGMLVYLVAAPGVGKTSAALQILNTMSKQNESCIFFSYDMYHSLIFQKLIQKHQGMTDKQIFSKFKNNDVNWQKDIIENLKKEYNNVQFCFKTGQTPSDIEKTIIESQEKTGKKPRLVVIDYNELVMSNMSDSTQSTADVAHRINAISKNHNVCVIMLVQPNKMAGSPADELKSYRSLKGSSSLEQAASVILGMNRPGYDPRHPDDDKFMTIGCLKNRMGSMFTLDLGWDGMRGEVYELSDEQLAQLKQVRERQKKEKEDKPVNGFT